MSERESFRLGEVVVNFDARRVPIKAVDRKPGPYPYYGASGIVDSVDDYLFDGEFLLVAEDGENLRTRNTPVAFIARGRFWVNNHAHVLQGNQFANTQYLCYALAGTEISGFLSGSTQPKLTQHALSSIPVYLPDRGYQDAVVAVLGALDDKIAANERIADSSRRLAQVLFEAARAAGDGSQIAISDVAGVVSRGVTPRYTDDVNNPLVLNQKCIRDGRASLLPARRTLSDKVPTSKFLNQHDVLVNSTGVGTLGRVALWAGHETCTVDSHVTIVRFDERKVDPVCAGFAMLDAQSLIEAMGEGSTGQTELSRTKLGALKLLMPQALECLRLRPKLDALEGLGRAALVECSTLAKLRDTLLPKLMSGEIRVREAEKVVEEAL